MSPRETLSISEALKEREIQAINAPDVIERLMRQFADELKAELAAELLEPLKAVARVLADQAADRQRPAGERPLMDLKEIVEVSGWSESTIRRKMDAGEFPKPVTPRGKKQKWKRKDAMRAIQGG